MWILEIYFSLSPSAFGNKYSMSVLVYEMGTMPSWGALSDWLFQESTLISGSRLSKSQLFRIVLVLIALKSDGDGMAADD